MSHRNLMSGVYRHYKNHLYLVLGYAGDASIDGRVVVVYVGLDLDGAKSSFRMRVREEEDFFAVVDPATGLGVEPGQEGVPRFVYLGPAVNL